MITDSVVQKKFSGKKTREFKIRFSSCCDIDWIIDYQPFSSLSPSNEFEQCYSPIPVDVPVPIKQKRGRPKRSIDNQIDLTIKQHICNDEKVPDLSIKRKRGRPRKSEQISIEKEETQIVTRSRNRKRHFDEDDETSVDDISLAIRSRKVSAVKPAYKTKAQV